MGAVITKSKPLPEVKEDLEWKLEIGFECDIRDIDGKWYTNRITRIVDTHHKEQDQIRKRQVTAGEFSACESQVAPPQTRTNTEYQRPHAQELLHRLEKNQYVWIRNTKARWFLAQIVDMGSNSFGKWISYQRFHHANVVSKHTIGWDNILHALAPLGYEPFEKAPSHSSVMNLPLTGKDSLIWQTDWEVFRNQSYNFEALGDFEIWEECLQQYFSEQEEIFFKSTSSTLGNRAFSFPFSKMKNRWEELLRHVQNQRELLKRILETVKKDRVCGEIQRNLNTLWLRHSTSSYWEEIWNKYWSTQ